MPVKDDMQRDVEATHLLAHNSMREWASVFLLSDHCTSSISRELEILDHLCPVGMFSTNCPGSTD